MLEPARTCEVRVRWRDRGGSKGYSTLRLPFSIAPDTAFSVATTIVSAMQAISDAVPDQFDIYYRWRDTTPPPAAIGSDTARFVAFYYSNGVDSDAIFVPSPNPAIFEAAGPYAGIRVDTANPAVLSAVEVFNLALETAGASVSFPVGPGFVAGGRVL